MRTSNCLSFISHSLLLVQCRENVVAGKRAESCGSRLQVQPIAQAQSQDRDPDHRGAELPPLIGVYLSVLKRVAEPARNRAPNSHANSRNYFSPHHHIIPPFKLFLRNFGSQLWRTRCPCTLGCQYTLFL